MVEKKVRRPVPPAGFFPVVNFPEEIVLFDFSGVREHEDMTLEHPWGIGKYLEHRPKVYLSDLFRAHDEEPRDLHMGVDLFAPVGAEVFAFSDSTLLFQGYNPNAGDYGNVIVTESKFGDLSLFVLYGHLDSRSIHLREVGTTIKGGSLLGYVGDKKENGGYPPHVHFQISYVRPTTHDMPGAVKKSELEIARLHYPNPSLVLGEMF